MSDRRAAASIAPGSTCASIPARARAIWPSSSTPCSGAGVDIVQLREKGLEAADELRLLEVFAAAADRHGALFAVNDRADIALAAGAPVLHLGQDDLPVRGGAPHRRRPT